MHGAHEGDLAAGELVDVRAAAKHVVDHAVVQRIRDARKLQLVDEVGEADELQRVAKRGASQHGADLDGRGLRVLRPRKPQPRETDRGTCGRLQ